MTPSQRPDRAKFAGFSIGEVCADLRHMPMVRPIFSADLRIQIQHKPRILTWAVAGNQVHMMPPQDFALLSEKAKISLFNTILARYRSLSQHPQGMYSAAMIVTSSGKIFIAANAQRQREYHKDCAEVNVVNAMTQLDQPGAKVEEIYIMVGRYDPSRQFNASEVEHPFCPCGKCCDLLRSVSTANAKLYALPANDGSLKIRINERASSVREVLAGQVWMARLSLLLKDSYLALSPAEQELGLAAMETPEWHNVSDITEPDRLIRDIPRILSTMDRRLERNLLAVKALMLRLATNQLAGIDSIATLDVAHAGSAEEFLREVNRHLMTEIIKARFARKGLEKNPGDLERVRCALVRLDDGTFHSHIEAEGKLDNALPYAEVLACADSDRLKRKITDIWISEFCSEDIQQGVFQTSPKEALERVYKRRPLTTVLDASGEKLSDSVNVHYILPNSGSLSAAKIRAITRSYRIEDLYTSVWKGALYLKNKEQQSP